MTVKDRLAGEAGAHSFRIAPETCAHVMSLFRRNSLSWPYHNEESKSPDSKSSRNRTPSWYRPASFKSPTPICSNVQQIVTTLKYFLKNFVQSEPDCGQIRWMRVSFKTMASCLVNVALVTQRTLNEDVKASKNGRIDGHLHEIDASHFLGWSHPEESGFLRRMLLVAGTEDGAHFARISLVVLMSFQGRRRRPCLK